MKKRKRIEIWATQGQGEVRIWKGCSMERALRTLFKSIGSGSSLAVKINNTWIK